MPQPPPKEVKCTRGPHTAVPCPHCGKPNDFEPQKDLGTIERGQVFDCDHCGRKVEIHQVQTVTVVYLKQFVPQAKRR